MKVAIDRIKVAERIRKEVKHVPELADDINKNGLLQSIIVMPSGEDFKLLAGLRRLKAVQSLGWTEIEANVLPPKDAETALRIEISENEQREPFTFSEKAYYGKLLEDVEKAKAAERERAGVKIDKGNPSTHGHKGRATENVGAALGISGTHYERIRYIANNAPAEVIDELDKGVRSIHRTYDELRATAKSETKPVAATVKTIATEFSAVPQLQPKPKAMPKINPLDLISAKDREQIAKNCAFDSLSSDEKISELQRQLRAERARAASAESDLARERKQHQIDNYHNSGTIEMLKRENAELIARIKELEEPAEGDAL
ncbi:hypothetical protein FACS1894217_08830 [Clostridia bacterium]|nr:hypothetical protein FACS1894217_08830 [Clostridia bacterium]